MSNRNDIRNVTFDKIKVVAWTCSERAVGARASPAIAPVKR